MAFIVMYERTDGTLAAESCDDLDAAVMAAERLRNVDSIERPRIYETNEIQYDFQPYFRVQVAGAAAVGGSTVFADSSTTDTTGSAGSTTADSATADGIDWPKYGSSSDDASAKATDSADTAEGDVNTAVADGQDSPVEAVEADLASVEEAEASIEAPEADDSYVSDLDVLNVDEDDSDIDLTEGEAGSAAGDQKQGLFDKFVKTLEGDGTEVAADQVDDLGSTETSRRGLFGR